MAKLPSLITAIELGTSGIKLLMGECSDDETMIVHGFVERRTQGKVLKGGIVQVDALTDMLAEDLNKLEKQARQRIRTVAVAITGAHIRSVNAKAALPITSKDRTISENDALTALSHAEAYNLPIDRRSLHRYQKPFLIDGQRRAVDPRGMVGNQLTANIHIIHGDENTARTTESIIDNVMGEPPDELCFSAIADYHGLGLVDATQRGVLIVDLGAGVTEYALMYEDTCVHSGQVTVGTEHLANDLSIGLRLPIARCRDILRHDANARRVTDAAAVTIQVETMIGHPPRIIKKSTIETIVELRLTELFDIIKQDLERAEVRQMIGDRVIICGGGAAIPDICPLAESVLNVPVVVGRPAGVSGAWSEMDSPRMVTLVGLLHYTRFMAMVRDEDDPSFWQVLSGDWSKLIGILGKAFRP